MPGQSPASSSRTHHVSAHDSTPWRVSPIIILLLLVLASILAGAVLLLLPAAHQPGATVTVLDCLFTATSALTLTGLVTVNTAATWSVFGQVVILLLLQLGALGYMVLATIVSMLLGVRMGLPAWLQLRDAQGYVSVRGALRVAPYIIGGTLALEGLGTVLLSLRFMLHDHMALPSAVYAGLFYAVSAFCNTGFDLAAGAHGLGGGIDIWLLIILGGLILLGGLGFGVLAELLHRPRNRRFSVHTKLALITTVVLIAVGTLLVMLFEVSNPATLGSLDPAHRMVSAVFLPISARSAGISPFSLAVVTPPTLFMLGLLTVIGASPTGTGGGVKTTTAAVIILAIITLLRRRPDIEFNGRRISGETVRLALSLVSVYLLAMLLLIIGISFPEISQRVTEQSASASVVMARYAHLVFEVLCAVGNVGFPTGLTAQLQPLSRVLLMVGMLLGRLGPLVFIYIFAQPKRTLVRRLAVEPVMVG